MTKELTVERLKEMFIKAAKKGNTVPYFYRGIATLPIEKQNEVWRQLEDEGYSRDRKPILSEKKNRREKVYWDDSEWDKFIDIVWRMRQNDPAGKFGNLAQKAMTQMPASRRKPINSNFVKAAADRYRVVTDKLLDQADEVVRLKSKLDQITSAPTKEEILNNLTNEEILRFTNDVLNLLSPEEIIETSGIQTPELLDRLPLSEIVGYVAQKMIENMGFNFQAVLNSFSNSTQGEIKHSIPGVRNTHEPKIKALQKIAVIGTKGDQFQQLNTKVSDKAQLVFLDKDKNFTIPQGLDAVVLWTRFCSHSAQERVQKALTRTSTRLVRHDGGLDTMAERITAMAGR